MHIKVGENKFLVSQTVENAIPANGPVNTLLLIDRSGSMGWTLTKLVKQAFTLLVKHLKPGDTVTVGWFSGQGQFGWAVKAFTMNGDNSTLEKMLDSLGRSVGLTCFSEILADTENVIRELSAISTAFELFLLTDGCPVVKDEKKEIAAIFTAIAAVKGKLNSATLVGYGDYYNKALMADMAMALGGSLIHESNLERFDSMLKFLDGAKGQPRLAVKLKTKAGTAFTIHKNSVVAQRPENDEVRVTAPEDGRIWVLTSEPPSMETPRPITDAPGAAYAAAYVFSQAGQSMEAVQVLSQIGDVGLTTRLYNARTNEEYGLAEKLILDAVYHKAARCKDGFKVGCAPDSNAFSVMDVVSLLMNDPVAALWPMHPKLDYKSIGPKPVPDGDFPKFKAYNEYTPFNSLAWNKSRLNLSVRCLIRGEVELRGDLVGNLTRQFKAWKWANRAIINDGYLNIKHLPVTVSAVTKAALIKAGVPMDVDGQVLILHLDELPIVNQAFVADNTSIRKLFADKVDTLYLEANIKALKWKRDQLDPERATAKPVSNFTAAEVELLAKNGILEDGQYSPPLKKAEPTDFYTAVEMEVTVKSFSSTAACDKVADKLEKGTKLTPSELVMAKAMRFLSAMPTGSRLEALAWLDEELKASKADLEAIRARMAATKLGVTLGKVQWQEFKDRQDVYELQLGDFECKLEIKPVQVKF